MEQETLEEVLKLLHDHFDWNLTDSLTTTGEKLVADTIKALSIVKQEQDKNKYSEEEIILAIKNSYGIKYFSEKKFLENLKQFKKK
jgi:hypothetical protein